MMGNLCIFHTKYRNRQVEIKAIKCLKELVKSVQAGQICSFDVKLGTSAENWLKSGGKIRRGMVLVGAHKEYKATRYFLKLITERSFIGEIWTIDRKAEEIIKSHQSLINCHNVRQAVIIKPAPEGDLLNLPGASNSTYLTPLKPSEKDPTSPSPSEEIKLEFPILEKKRSRSCSGMENRIQISEKRTKALFKFLYHPEYMELGSTFVVADQKFKVIGEITRILYDA